MILANKRRREDFQNKLSKEIGSITDSDVSPLLNKFLENHKNADICDEIYKSLFKILRKKSETDFKL